MPQNSPSKLLSKKFILGTGLYGWSVIPYHAYHARKINREITIKFSVEQGNNDLVYDVGFYVMNEAPFLKWFNELPAQQSNVTIYTPKDVVHKIAKTVEHSVKLNIVEDQTLYLIFNNTHSVFTRKHITLEIIEDGKKTESEVVRLPAEFIHTMWESGKFSKPISLWDIQNFAKSEGYTFTKSAITLALKKLDFIVYAGRHSNGVPKYAQAYPPKPLPENAKLPEHIKIFESLVLHPEIRRVSSDLFKDGHYSQAITEALKKVNNMVKSKSGKHDLDGKPLMLTVFSSNSPILKLNQLRTITERDEQEGFMHLFAGSIQGIRNPKVHDEITQDDPFKTIEYLCLASLLAKAVDTSML